MLNSVMNWL